MISLKKLGAKQALIVELALLVVLAGLVIWKIATGSSVGTVYAPPAPKTQAPTIKQVGVNGQYISFSYPSNFGVSPADKPGGNELETFAYIKRLSPFWFLNITVSSLPSGNVADDGSYNSRITQPEHYSVSSVLINGQTVKIFSDNTSAYSKAAFMARGDKDVSVALSADAADGGLDQILTTVLDSISWH